MDFIAEEDSSPVITIPLRDLALPAPRSGSIDAYSGSRRSAAEGQEIHRAVQKKRAKADPTYRSEVSISGVLERSGYRFRVEGRIDGIFGHDPPVIEEIKSSFAIGELSRLLAENPLGHPYSLQLQTYGFLYWLQHGVVPRLILHLVSFRTRKSQNMEVLFDLSSYQDWLDRRLDELVAEVQATRRRSYRRMKCASQLTFPFAFLRPGQEELMLTIGEGMKKGRPLLVQAPTGMGKTVGILHPVLKEALQRGEKVLYLTPKNSQQSVAEDAVRRFQKGGARLRALSLTAKAKICFKNEPLCTPDYCEYAREYYDKLGIHGLTALLDRKRNLTARVFRHLGEKYEVCPFELQFEAVPGADIIICDYNYVFAPRSARESLTAGGLGKNGKPNLVIDEAHNMPVRAMECYSPALSSLVLEKMRGELERVPVRFRREAEELLDSCIKTVTACGGDRSSVPMRIEPPVETFIEQGSRLNAFLSKYLESQPEIPRHDMIVALCSYWSTFTDTLEYAGDPEKDEFFTTFQPHAGGGSIRITCCDASAMIRGCYAAFQQVVGFSATLKPFEYYARLSGLCPELVQTAEFQTPFPRERRKILLIPQISTRFSHRERSYGKIAEAIARIAGARRGNYLVFVPSFTFLDRVLLLFQPPPDFEILRQERDITLSRVQAMLDHLREGLRPTILFAVQGGSFSEGIDYVGEMVIGAFVVGPPLPTYDLEREEMRRYYQRRYGEGFSYAYTIPAMAKAVQAAGRVIRSERDCGLIVLMDSRFMEPSYSRSMPQDWFESEVSELVSGSIMKEVACFWQSVEGQDELSGGIPVR